MLLSDFPISMASAKLVGSFYVLNSLKSIDLSSYDYDFIIIQTGPALTENDNQKVFLAKNSSVYYYYNSSSSTDQYSTFKIENNKLLRYGGTQFSPENDQSYIDKVTIYLFKYV